MGRATDRRFTSWIDLRALDLIPPSRRFSEIVGRTREHGRSAAYSGIEAQRTRARGGARSNDERVAKQASASRDLEMERGAHADSSASVARFRMESSTVATPRRQQYRQ